MGQDRRLEFQNVLTNVLGQFEDEPNVYFQPPPTLDMQYPCIVYERDNQSVQRADNFAYNWRQRYQVTYIDKDPDGAPIDLLTELPLSEFSRHFVTSGLNHDVFSIYY